MVNLVLTAAALERALTIILSQEQAPTISLRLSSTVADALPPEPEANHFVEVIGGGYQAIQLAPSDWSVDGDLATLSQKLFTFTGGIGGNNTVHAIYLTYNSTGELMGYALLDAADRFVPATGDMLAIQIGLTLTGVTTGGMVLTNGGATIFLRQWLGLAVVDDLVIGLYAASPDFSPTRQITLGADCAALVAYELAGTGYDAKSIAAEDWTLSYANRVAQARLVNQNFIFTSGSPNYPGTCQGVRGYFIRNSQNILCYLPASEAAFPNSDSPNIRTMTTLALQAIAG